MLNIATEKNNGIPPKLTKNTLRTYPLGGLGEVGRNMTVYELNGKILIVDCGVLFPEEEQPGIDLILPDIAKLEDRLNDIVGIVLTHGHEDHIGGVPYLLKMRQDIPLYGSQLTLALLQAKCKEHRLTPKMHVVAAGETTKLAGFELEFVAVNHSIPDALAVAIRTVAGLVLATGDFKMDQLPLDGRITDLRAFAKLGEEGVDLFQADSTNADVPGFTPLEKEIGPVLEQVVSRTIGKVIVVSFSSHVHRVQQVLDAAQANDRQVVLLGRSMVRNMKIAADLGYLRVPKGILISEAQAADVPDEYLVYMSTGSQGEPMAVLSRMVKGDHRVVPGKDDTVILASSLIPGNENAVFRVIDGLVRMGCNVVHKGNAKVHVSGHAAAGELLYCYNIIKPKNVMPIHGEYRHLVANASLAIQTGILPERALICENGSVVDLRAGVAKIVGKIETESMYIDGKSVGKITEHDLQTRMTLGSEGFVSAIAVVSAKTGKLVNSLEIHARGVAEEARVFDEIKPQLIKALEKELAAGKRDRNALQKQMRQVLGRWLGMKLRRRAVIMPVVVVID
ncbi:ribonuclease J [Canibacter zhuwentaonis]|uniref:ribonuclease J n=1 Tax=Canibacter zhuwentaonis TaxID=2837491 RepID=UPI00350F2767